MSLEDKLNIKIEQICLSKYTFLILLISFGIILITIGVHLGLYYIIPGDSWAELKFANYIDKPFTSPIEKGKQTYSYPILWCYDSTILIESDYFIRTSIFSMTYAEFRYIRDFFNSDDTEIEMIDEISNLRDNKIQYILISKDFLYECKNVPLFIRNHLIPNFYNESKYDSDNYRIYYAPYFD